MTNRKRLAPIPISLYWYGDLLYAGGLYLGRIVRVDWFGPPAFWRVRGSNNGHCQAFDTEEKARRCLEQEAISIFTEEI